MALAQSSSWKTTILYCLMIHHIDQKHLFSFQNSIAEQKKNDQIIWWLGVRLIDRYWTWWNLELLELNNYSQTTTADSEEMDDKEGAINSRYEIGITVLFLDLYAFQHNNITQGMLRRYNAVAEMLVVVCLSISLSINPLCNEKYDWIVSLNEGWHLA